MRRRRASSSTAVLAAVVAIVVAVAALGFGLYTNTTTNNEVSSLTASLSAQGVQIDGLQSNIVSLQSSLTAAQSTITTMQGSAASAQVTMTGLQSSLAAAQGTITVLQSSIAYLQAQLTSVSSRLNSTQASDQVELQQLSAEVQSLESTVQILINEVAALTTTSASPSLVTEAASTCSHVCSGEQTITPFSTSLKAGDLLVVSIVEDDLPTLVVTDSLGTTLHLAVRSSTSCGSPSGYCQADIYWGVLYSSGADSVTAVEPGSNAAIRVEVWEFSGVASVGNTASCTPTCASTSYPASSVLLATGSTVYSAAAGFAWYQYAFSGVDGSEYQVASSSGSTTFAFSPPTPSEEVGVVLLAAS